MKGSVKRAIRQLISEGDKLHTPAQAAEFEIGRIDNNGIVLLLGEQKAWTPLSWECLEGIPDFLGHDRWVVIGSKFDTRADSTTLDGYLKGHIKRATAGWVAAVLESAGIVEIDRGRPAKVRLKKSM